MNRSGAIGTAAETATVRYLNGNGFPHAERRRLRGGKDAGDITGTIGVAWEVKGGEKARNASDQQIELWLAEAEIERGHAGERLGVLVVARRGKNVRAWWAVMWADQLAELTCSHVAQLPIAARTPVRLTLAHAVALLRAAGYGDPLDDQEGIPA